LKSAAILLAATLLLAAAAAQKPGPQRQVFVDGVENQQISLLPPLPPPCRRAASWPAGHRHRARGGGALGLAHIASFNGLKSINPHRPHLRHQHGFASRRALRHRRHARPNARAGRQRCVHARLHPANSLCRLELPPAPDRPASDAFTIGLRHRLTCAMPCSPTVA